MTTYAVRPLENPNYTGLFAYDSAGEICVYSFRSTDLAAVRDALTAAIADVALAALEHHDPVSMGVAATALRDGPCIVDYHEDKMTTTYRAPCPLDAESALDQMHAEICDAFDNGDEIADRMFEKAGPHRGRLDELLTEAWAKFVDEAGLTEEHAEVEEG